MEPFRGLIRQYNILIAISLLALAIYLGITGVYKDILDFIFSLLEEV